MGISNRSSIGGNNRGSSDVEPASEHTKTREFGEKRTMIYFDWEKGLLICEEHLETYKLVPI